MMTWAQLGFQDAASPVMEEFLHFHDFVMVVLVGIIVFVGVAMGGALISPHINTGLLEGQVLECVWTILPAIILVQIAAPSLMLLYLLEESVESGLTVKALGHQWYWSYEYSDFWGSKGKVEFDAYMAPQDSAEVRLLEADNTTALPHSAHIRVLVSSADVLHAWAVPSLGVKVDACPGRLNLLNLYSHRPGNFFGQCSEICGANHSFMPICLEMISAQDFISWVAML